MTALHERLLACADQVRGPNWMETRALLLEAATALQSSGGEVVATCSYPKCNCPFDAPADPNWCARGLQRHQSEPLSPWPLFHVNGLPELSGALVRAVQKGYLPDALAAVVEAFDWLPASTTASPAQPSDAKDAARYRMIRDPSEHGSIKIDVRAWHRNEIMYGRPLVGDRLDSEIDDELRARAIAAAPTPIEQEG